MDVNADSDATNQGSEQNRPEQGDLLGSASAATVHHRRPGSPVMPMGDTANYGPGTGQSRDPHESPPKRSGLTGTRRLSFALGAIGLIAAGGIGAGITYAVTGSGSTITTSTTQNSPSSGFGIPSVGGSTGTASPYSGGITNPAGGSTGTGSPYSGGITNPFSGGSTGSTGAASPTTGSGAPSDISSIAAKVDPALVDINVAFNYQSASGAGTGIVLTSKGEVITNNHVVNGATSIRVTDIGNGKTYNATVVGYDDSQDIAVLQLKNASGLATATIGDSSTATVGEPIVAIGNAGGTGGTPSTAGGSITGLDQSVTASDELDGTNEQLSGLIGVNADVQPGDSGGSLVNSSGQVLGIDTAGSSGSTFEFSGQSASNQAFAIPINEAISIAKKIESGKGSSTIHVGSTAFLGVLISSGEQQGQSGGYFGGSGNTTTPSGAVISSVVSGGAAAKAGLGGGDTITSFDGKTVTSSSQLSKLLVPLHPGDKVQVTFTDSTGQSHTVTVDLGSGPAA